MKTINGREGKWEEGKLTNGRLDFCEPNYKIKLFWVH